MVTVFSGVVVTVVTVALQHVSLTQCPVAQTTSSPVVSNPKGQVKLPQLGSGVVVTVVYSSQQVALSHGGLPMLPHVIMPALGA